MADAADMATRWIAPPDSLLQPEVSPMSLRWYMGDPAFAPVWQGLRHVAALD